MHSVNQTLSGRCPLGLLPDRQLPVGPDEVARVSARIALQVVLVFRLRLPERTGRSHFGYHFTWPQPRGFDVCDRVFGDAPLLVTGVVDGRSIAATHVVALTIAGRRVVDLEEELQNLPVVDLVGIEDELDGFGVGSVIAIRS